MNTRRIVVSTRLGVMILVALALLLLLVVVLQKIFVTAVETASSPNRHTVSKVDFLGKVAFPTSFSFESTQVGGLSGMAYDAAKGVYYALSDDRSQTNPARFYTLAIDIADGTLDADDVTFQDVTTLLTTSGTPFPALSLDPEGIALSEDGTLFISSEGDASALTAPFVNEFTLAGQQVRALPVPAKFLPTTTPSGIRNNLAFESLTLSPSGRFLYTATENALAQDGPAADLDQESMARILKYDLVTGQPVQEFVYVTDPVADPPVPAGEFRTNGLVELIALDNNGTFLAMERSFSTGVGNTVKLYEVLSQGALDVSQIQSLFWTDNDTPFEIDPPVQKRLLVDFADLNITPDNLEALALGPQLADGRQTLFVVSDNNFSATQETQFIGLALTMKTTPAALPLVESPSFNNDEEAEHPGDADDPAIWVHPTDPSRSLVFVTLKDGGMAVLNLDAQILETILPAPFGDIRYNNVDLIYGFNLGGTSVDLAVASDRQNDTLAIYQINPNYDYTANPATSVLTNVTADTMIATIFGVDDGEQTAYGLATYTSPHTGKSYAFVTQADGNQIAQLELTDTGAGKVTAAVVRRLDLPIAAGDEASASQSEGCVVDRELGYYYVAIEGAFGVLKFNAEPDSGNEYTLIASIEEEYLQPDIEGLTIYYGPDSSGYLLVSSQGDSSYALFDRQGDNAYLGSFVIGDSDDIDQANESDGADVLNVALGPRFPNGLLVVQDGANDPQSVVQDEEQLENNSASFKFIRWEDVAGAFDTPLVIDPRSYDPRVSTLANGIAAGDTTQTSTVLWARSTHTGIVTFQYATDQAFSNIAGTQTATVTNMLQPVKVTVTNLTPDTTYYYRVTDAVGTKATGRFRTAAAVGTHTGLRFGVSGDWRGELSPYPAITNALARDLEFFVGHGDTIYADIESPVLPGIAQATTLAEYRLKHSEVYGTRFGINIWDDLRANTSILATIDDHEVTNDFSGGAPPSSDARFLPSDASFINATNLYNNGLQSFQEYNPLRDETYADTGDARSAGKRKLYRYNTYGSDAAIFLLDARSFRDQELPAIANPTDQAQVGAFLTAAFEPNRTMLGQVQLADLKRDLLQAQAAGITWKFILVPEPIQNLGPVGGQDRFEGYAAERTELLSFITSNRISNVVFIAADIHGTLVNNVTYQNGPGQAQIPTDVFEITTGSVAYYEPFGPTVVDIAVAAGILTAEQKATYDALPPAGQDQFVEALTNDSQLTPLGYDPIGLEGSSISATLLQGDYIATHVYGWSEFEIDATTQALTVTTYGIDAYSPNELLADPEAIIARTPAVVSQFRVAPASRSTMLYMPLIVK